jgi:hypothetical protein
VKSTLRLCCLSCIRSRPGVCVLHLHLRLRSLASPLPLSSTIPSAPFPARSLPPIPRTYLRSRLPLRFPSILPCILAHWHFSVPFSFIYLYSPMTSPYLLIPSLIARIYVHARLPHPVPQLNLYWI